MRRPGVGAARRSGFRGIGGGFRGIGGGSAPAYDPSSETGYAFDLFAAAANVTVVDDSGTDRVSSWTELVSETAYTQGTMADRPPWLSSEASLNSKPAVHFNGSHYMNAAIGIAASGHTFYLFANMEAITNSLRVLLGFAETTSARLYLYQTTNAASGPVGYFDGNVRSFSSGASTTGAQVLTWYLDRGSTGTGYRGESSIGTATCSAFSAGTSSRLGANPTTLGQYAVTRVGRLIGFSGLHDAATRARVWGWGESYYGITL